MSGRPRSATSSAPSATRQCCQKSPKPRFDRAPRSCANLGIRLADVVETAHSSIRDSAETRHRTPSANAPSPRAPTSAGRAPAPTRARARPHRPVRGRGASPRRVHRAHSSLCRRSDRRSTPAAAVRSPSSSPNTLSATRSSNVRADLGLLGCTIRLGRPDRRIRIGLHPQIRCPEPGQRDRVGEVRGARFPGGGADHKLTPAPCSVEPEVRGSHERRPAEQPRNRASAPDPGHALARELALREARIDDAGARSFPATNGAFRCSHHDAMATKSRSKVEERIVK